MLIATQFASFTQLSIIWYHTEFLSILYKRLLIIYLWEIFGKLWAIIVLTRGILKLNPIVSNSTFNQFILKEISS